MLIVFAYKYTYSTYAIGVRKGFMSHMDLGVPQGLTTVFGRFKGVEQDRVCGVSRNCGGK